VKIQHGDKTYCIDPGSEIEKCYIVLCTHMHVKHCSYEYLSSFKGELLVPSTHAGVEPGGIIQLGDTNILVVPAYSKPELYFEAPPHPKGCCVGYILRFPNNLNIYYMGDTSFIEEILRINEKITILIPPIGGGYVMTPEEALEVVKSLRPAITIPVHYDKVEQYYRFRDIAQPYTQVIKLS